MTHETNTEQEIAKALPTPYHYADNGRGEPLFTKAQVIAALRTASREPKCIWPDCGHDTNCVGQSACTGEFCPKPATPVSASEAVIDLRASFLDAIDKAVAEQTWMPPEYIANDWQADILMYLREGPEAFAPASEAVHQWRNGPHDGWHDTDRPERFSAYDTRTLYTHPAPASGEPAYDRELCADIMSQFYNALMAGELDWAGRYSGPCIDEQINLLRTADNRDAAGVRTVDWKARAERAEEVLKRLASGERSIAEIDAMLDASGDGQQTNN